LPSEITSAFLWAQLENLEAIQSKRKMLWNAYYEALKPFEEQGVFKLPNVPEYATQNGHMFYIVCKSLEQRTQIIAHLKSNDILAVFHYLSLHKSEYYQAQHDGRNLQNSDMYTDCLIRLPMYYELEEITQNQIIQALKNLK
jgi:dTDP-4-amino-4,6-dideoxygalactose transaminase